jgi:hypothetical protein
MDKYKATYFSETADQEIRDSVISQALRHFLVELYGD